VGFTPKLCSGVHQKNCDLEGVNGGDTSKTTYTPTHFKNMTEQNIQDQTFDLSDEQLADVAAGVDFFDEPEPNPENWPNVCI